MALIKKCDRCSNEIPSDAIVYELAGYKNGIKVISHTYDFCEKCTEDFHASAEKINTHVYNIKPSGKKPSDLLAPNEAAHLLGCAKGTLAIWRCKGRYDLPFHKIGRKIKYRKEDLYKFIEKNQHLITKKEINND